MFILIRTSVRLHCHVFHGGSGLTFLLRCLARIVFAFSQFAVSGGGDGSGRKYVIISSPRRLRMPGGSRCSYQPTLRLTQPHSKPRSGPTPPLAGRRNANGTEKRQQSY